MYEEETFTGVSAGTQACCQAVLQTNLNSREAIMPLTSASVHWCCVTAQLCEEKMSIGVIAVT